MSAPVIRPPASDSPARTQEREDRLRRDAQVYIENLRRSLEARNAQVVRQFERAERQRVEAVYQNRLAERIAELRAEKDAEIVKLQRQIAESGFRRVAFQTQVRVYRGQSREDARVQAQAITERIEKMERKLARLRLDVRPEAETQLKQSNADLNAEADRNVTARRAELERNLGQTMARIGAGLAAQSDAIPPISEDSLPDATAASLPASPGPPPHMQREISLVAALSARAVDRAREQNRLLTVIREDTQQAILQIAREQGWRLASRPSLGVPDVTAALRMELASQWKPRAN